jgi:hypothetical protein
MRSITAAHPKDRADIEDNFRKTVGKALVGVFSLARCRACLLWMFQTLQANQRSARDLLISNQVAKGFELLGSAAVANAERDA